LTPNALKWAVATGRIKVGYAAPTTGGVYTEESLCLSSECQWRGVEHRERERGRQNMALLDMCIAVEEEIFRRNVLNVKVDYAAPTTGGVYTEESLCLSNEVMDPVPHECKGRCTALLREPSGIDAVHAPPSPVDGLWPGARRKGSRK